ncbi:TIR domain-containing protein [Pseudofrankia sp. BMG5.36]|uniref:TIR domain-containing protein n=1 Tax=Pseudofrankia sp. BMG5.36 TaxID=1834512 RepID=UPI0008D928EC|nr:TIR domain-containing protein [Pseudofrankia sp. BMG5.36]OHV50352.1 hypothetical protein BCD48_10750 [Pseudofrankia sp. BMG5.36]
MRPGESPYWDFFVTYAAGDVIWAEWIAWQLEDAGYRVLLEAWDGVPGTYQAAVADQGIAHAARVIALVSPAYLRPGPHHQARSAALSRDQDSPASTLLPIQVEPCDPVGLLREIRPIRLFGYDDDTTRARLLGLTAAAVSGRAKPSVAPRLPGADPPAGHRAAAPPTLPAARGPEPGPVADRLGSICADLAVDLRRQAREEGRRRGDNALRPATVRWQPADEAIFEGWPLLVRRALDRASGVRAPTPDTWATGPGQLARGPDLHATLRQVPTRRLVVLGAAGSGKSTLLYQLRADLLDSLDAGRGDAVPVLIHISSWTPRPGEPTFRSWLVEMIGGFPALRRLGRAAARETAGDLLDEHRLLLLLDGLDEISPRYRGPAIDEISRQLDQGQEFVLTCGTREYRDAVSPGEGAETSLAGSAGIELCPLDLGVVENYLRDVRPGQRTLDSWEPVLRTLAGAPSHPVALALTNPLALALAIQVYMRPAGTGRRDDPAELLTRGFADPGSVRRHLLGALIAAEYPAGRRGWTRERAQRWFSFLAHHLESEGGGPDLAWWRLAAHVPGPMRHRLLLAAGTAVWVPLAVAALATGAAGSAARRLFDTSPPWQGVGLVLAVSLCWCVGICWLVFCAPPHGGGLRHWGRRAPASRVCWSRVPRARDGTRRRTRALPTGLLTFAVTTSALSAVVDAGPARLSTPLILAFWFATGPAAAVAVALLSRFTTDEMAAGAPAGPAQARSGDRRRFVLLAVLLGGAAGLCLLAAVGLLFALPARVTPRLAVGAGLVVGLGYGVPYGLARAATLTTWPAYTVTRLWLAWRGDLPWRLGAFLDDAHDRRQILRRVGAVHQFRHIELQRQLGGNVPDPLAARLAEQTATHVRALAVAGPVIPLRWQAAAPELAPPWPLLRDVAGGWPGGSPEAWAEGPDGLAGTGTRLAPSFARIPTHRLVVLGPEGSGRTTLLAALARDLLAARLPTGPVPVLLSPRSWDPERDDLATWLEYEIGCRHTWLGWRTAAVSRAGALLARRKVLPLLDGLEEIPAERRARALDRIGDWLADGLPLVLSCAPEAWRDLVEAPPAPRSHARPAGAQARWGLARRRLPVDAPTPIGRAMARSPQPADDPAGRGAGASEAGEPAWPSRLARLAAAVVEIRPVGLAGAAAYLAASTPGPDGVSWDPLLHRAAADPAGPVAGALTSPLVLSLLADGYGKRRVATGTAGRAPAELTDASRFPTAGSVQEHLAVLRLRRALAPDDATAPAVRAAAVRLRALAHLALCLDGQPLASAQRSTGGRERDRSQALAEFGWWDTQTLLAVPAVVTALGVLSGVLTLGIMIEMAGLAVGLVSAVGIGLLGVVVTRLMLARTGMGAGPVPAIRDYARPAGRDRTASGPVSRWRPAGPRAVLRRCRWTVPAAVVITAVSCGVSRPVCRAGGMTPLTWPWGPASTPATAAAVTAAALSCALMMTAWGRYQLSRWWLSRQLGTPADLIGVLEDAAERGVIRQVGDRWMFAHPCMRRALAAAATVRADGRDPPA